ncbi:MAG: ribosome silencing factor [Bacteroidetes bacterium]|nr:ribosome silencing factor [Bacteroidota bacterium]
MTVKLKNTKKKQATSTELIRHAVKGIEEKKGSDIVCINLKKIPNSACDYFLICEGNSRTQVQAIAGSVEEMVKQNTGSRPWHVEGLQNAEWVLMDYVDVAVHIFQPEARSHYNLENMWADADIKEIKEEVTRKETVKKKTKKKIVKAKKKVVKRKIKRKK